MTQRAKQIVFFSFILIAAGLFIYGQAFHALSVQPHPDEGADVFAALEPVLIREVTVGGLMVDESGMLRKTYTGAPPRACPT
jgi:hypothetical protein